MSRLSFFIGRRYLFSKGKKQKFLSFLTLIAILGVCLGVTVPIVVMSVFNGFQETIQQKILGIRGHIFIFPSTRNDLQLDPKMLQTIKDHKEVQSVTPIIESQGLIKNMNKYEYVNIRAIDQTAFEEDPVFKKLYQITEGSNDLSRRYFVNIGSELSKNNFVLPGERVQLVTVKSKGYLENEHKNITALVTGVFKTGFNEYDQSYIYTSLVTLQKAFNYENACTQLEIKLNDIWKTDEIVQKLSDEFPQYNIYSWKDLNRNLFIALAREKLFMWLIVILILLVAIFNVMSGQIMSVLDKQREIAILKTLGCTPLTIAKIFFFEGLMITGIGTFFGTLLGSGIANYFDKLILFVDKTVSLLFAFLGLFLSSFSEKSFSLFPKDVYYLEEFPNGFSLKMVLFVILCALILSIISGLVPAIRASRLKPIQILRNE